MWHPTQHMSEFGLGGEIDDPPLCVCGSPLTHIGVFPFKKNIFQFFYCFDCEKKTAQNSNKTDTNSFLFRVLSEKSIAVASKKIDKKSKDIPWISHKATSATMSLKAKSYLNEYKPGEGVYTYGQSLMEHPECPACQKPMVLALSVDSFAHECFSWGDFECLFLFVCPAHLKNTALRMMSPF